MSGHREPWLVLMRVRPASTCPAEYIRDDEPDHSDDAIWDTLYSHADQLKAFARRLGFTLIIFQPLSQFEGWPTGSKRSDWVRRKAERWLPLCSKLGVNFLQVRLSHTVHTQIHEPDCRQVGTNDEPEATVNFDKEVEDMAWLAELGASQPNPVKISYEPWCFSPHRPDWEYCWEIVKAAVSFSLTIQYRRRR